MDRVSAERRSFIMSQVRGKNTGPEMVVRRLLHRNGFRFGLHRSDLPGTPDIALPRYRLAIFVNGCFWHGHRSCKKAQLPKSRVEYWRNKIEANIARDVRVAEELNELGWRHAVIWQCQTRDQEELSAIIDRLLGGADSVFKNVTHCR